MARGLLTDATLRAIGDAIRQKTGETDAILPSDMPAEIGNIDTYDPFAGFEMLSSFQYVGGAPDARFVASVPKCTSLSSAFSTCSELLDIELTVTTLLRNLSSFAYHAKIKSIAFTGTTEKVTTFARFAENAVNLTSVTGLNFSSATNTSLSFSGCAALVDVGIVAGTIKVSISFADSPLLSDTSIQSIVDGLADLTGLTAQTLTLHADVKSKLTDEQTAAITAKNWTIA